MTDVFSVGMATLYVTTAIFFIVFFSFIFYWHLKKITVMVLPVVFTFEFFVMGFLVVVIVSIIFNYLPVLIKLANI